MFIKATADSKLNHVAWTLRTLRSFFYEARGYRIESMADSLAIYIRKKFPTLLL